MYLAAQRSIPRCFAMFSCGSCPLMVLLCSCVSATPIAGQIVGRVVDPVAGAHLKLANAGGNLVREATSGEGGTFILDPTQSGDHRLTVEATSFVTVAADVAVGHGQRKEVTL